jgi:hypothetical protein
MFKDIAPGVIESSDGFAVDSHGHFELTYTEDGRVAKFYCEPGTHAYIYSLDVPITWDPVRRRGHLSGTAGKD